MKIGDGFLMYERFMFLIVLLLGFIITLCICMYFQSSEYIQICPTDVAGSPINQVFKF